MQFSRILVANRGEIACRILRTAKTMGYLTVAVFTKVDQGAPHVSMAHQAVCIGDGDIVDSYLSIDKIMTAARKSGADAIHPGYGFLSENGEFARACQAANITFIGPSAEAIDVMGNKAQAKRLMIDAGVPCVPGYQGAEQSTETLVEQAHAIGFPVMLKASAGGGGRGMRLVDDPERLVESIDLAKSEALSAFGNDELIIEKAIEHPRHIEIQVFGDSQGNVVHLGERDCSIQRRHQKIIEEAPSVAVDPALREKMGGMAVAAARSIKYYGAGTVEFLLAPTGEFYFLEMNTRLQVEHPVTELITGLDLVAMQIKVARGEALEIDQDQVKFDGHAIEARLYAEDVYNDFMPQSGRITLWRPSQHVRIDSGIKDGLEVSPFYDPMMAKVISHGETREQARRRLVEALQTTLLFGLKSNQEFLLDCMLNDSFIDADVTTSFINQEFGDSICDQTVRFEHAAVAAVLDYLTSRDTAFESAVSVSQALLGWSSADQLLCYRTLQQNEQVFPCRIRPSSGNHQSVFIVDQSDASLEIEVVMRSEHRATINIDGESTAVGYYAGTPGTVSLNMNNRTFSFVDQASLANRQSSDSNDGLILAPMHGLVKAINVTAGQRVESGQSLVVLEAMKMQHQVRSEIEGTIKLIHVEAQQQVVANQCLIEVDPLLEA